MIIKYDSEDLNLTKEQITKISNEVYQVHRLYVAPSERDENLEKIQEIIKEIYIDFDYVLFHKSQAYRRAKMPAIESRLHRAKCNYLWVSIASDPDIQTLNQLVDHIIQHAKLFHRGGDIHAEHAISNIFANELLPLKNKY